MQADEAPQIVKVQPMAEEAPQHEVENGMPKISSLYDLQLRLKMKRMLARRKSDVSVKRMKHMIETGHAHNHSDEHCSGDDDSLEIDVTEVNPNSLNTMEGNSTPWFFVKRKNNMKFCMLIKLNMFPVFLVRSRLPRIHVPESEMRRSVNARP